jgi:hypothetical protein
MPGLALIIRVQDLIGGHAMLGQNDQTSMITDFIDVGALVDLGPVKASISREVGGNPICELAVKPFTKISDCKNETNSTILGVGRSEQAIMRVYLKVKRAPFVDIAIEFLAIRVNCRGRN